MSFWTHGLHHSGGLNRYPGDRNGPQINGRGEPATPTSRTNHRLAEIDSMAHYANFSVRAEN